MSQETRHEIIEGIMEGSYPIDPREQSTTDARNKRHSARCNDSETNLQSYLFVMHNGVLCYNKHTYPTKPYNAYMHSRNKIERNIPDLS